MALGSVVPMKKKVGWIGSVPETAILVLKAAARTAYAGAGGIFPAGGGHEARRKPAQEAARQSCSDVLRVVEAGAASPRRS